jgi:mannose-6-phosphate isomerase-like protein (cupin superfamily)
VKRADDFFPDSFIHQKQPKRSFFPRKRAQKRIGQLNSLLFQQEAHETEQKKRRKLFIKNCRGCDEEVLVKEEEELYCANLTEKDMSSLENGFFDEEKEFRRHHPEHFLLGNALEETTFEEDVRGWQRNHQKGEDDESGKLAPRNFVRELFAGPRTDKKMVEVQLSDKKKNASVSFSGSTYDRKSTRMDIDDFLRHRVPPDSSGVNFLGEGQHSLYLAQEDVPEAMAKHLDSFKPYAEGLKRYVYKRWNVRLSANIQRRVWMNHERVETTPHYDDYDNVLFVWTGRKTVHLKAFRGDGFHFCVANTEVANHAHPEALPDPESYEYTFVVNAGEAVFIPMGWIHRVESDEGTIAIAHEIQDALSIEFIHNTVSRLDYPWDESLYLVRRKIESKIDWKFTSLVAELIDSKNEEIKTRAKITHENVAYIKSKCEEGKEVEFEINNPEQLMENVSQSCAILVDGGKEEGIDDEIPKYRKDVLAMNPLQAKLHTLQLSLLKDYLGESKFEKWIGDCSLKYAESRGPEWKREDTCKSILCEKVYEYDFHLACEAVVELARRRSRNKEHDVKKEVDDCPGSSSSSVVEEYKSLSWDYKLIGGWPRGSIRKPFDPHVAAFGLL